MCRVSDARTREALPSETECDSWKISSTKSAILEHVAEGSTYVVAQEVDQHVQHFPSRALASELLNVSAGFEIQQTHKKLFRRRLAGYVANFRALHDFSCVVSSNNKVSVSEESIESRDSAKPSCHDDFDPGPEPKARMNSQASFIVYSL